LELFFEVLVGILQYVYLRLLIAIIYLVELLHNATFPSNTLQV
jgi:hypothetical protein